MSIISVYFPIILAIIGVSTQSLGYVLQKVGIVEFNNFKQFLSNKKFYIWLIGTLCTVIGTILFFSALPLSNISTIQPIIGIGPAIVAILSYFIFKSNLHKNEKIGIGFTVFGIIFLSIDTNALASELVIKEVDFFFISVLIIFIIFLISVVLMKIRLLDIGLEEGIIAGLFGGFSSIYAKIGFFYLFNLQIHWSLFVLINTQAVSFILLQKGLHSGKVEKVTSVFTGMSILVPLMIGIVFFGEKIGIFTIIGILIIILGSIMLTRVYSDVIK